MPTTLFVMLDGVRPDALTAADCRNVAALRTEGASTMNATSVMPCITLPCHTSIFHSVPPSRHGITTNLWTPMARPLPGLLEILRAAKKRAAFFYNWEPLRDLGRPGSLHYSYFRDSAYTAEGDDLTADETARYLAAEQPDFLFLYLGTVDSAGHAYGWMSHEYLRQLERVDSALGRVLNALPANGNVLVQADHGGHDRSHGENVPEDMTIPWLVRGPGIRRGHAIQSPVSLLDSAPTLARLMGVESPPEWEGRVVEEIFDVI